MGLKFIQPSDARVTIDLPPGEIRKETAPALPDKVADRWDYTVLRATSTSLSLAAAAEGGYGPLFGTVNTDLRYHLLELTAGIPLLGLDADGADAVYGRHVAAGLSTNDTSTAISYAIANATLHGKSNTFNVVCQGIADSATGTLRGAAGGRLLVDSAPAFGKGIAECVDWIIAEAPATDVEARPGSVFQVTQPQVCELRSLCYALGQIASGRTCEQAGARLHHLQSQARSRAAHVVIDETLVAATYHRFRVKGAPSADQRVMANELLNGGGKVPDGNDARAKLERPVMPYLTRGTRAVASLLHLVDDPARVAANPWPPTREELSVPRQDIGERELTLAATLDVGLGSLADVHAGVDYRFFDYHAMSTYRRGGAANTIIIGETYSAGIRATVRYEGTDLSLASQVAAKVTLGQTAASYCVDILGVDVEKVPSLATFAGGCLGAFDAQTLSRIGSVWKETNDVIAAKKPDAAWKPCLTAVEIDLGADELQRRTGRAGAITFALAKIGRWRLSEVEALKQTPLDYVDQVKRVYRELGVTAAPSDDAVEAAKAILRLGR
jgi:hypothetical protein